jgi:energy-coupling factor transport system ATP-binding protein
MEISCNNIEYSRDEFTLGADAGFSEGLHIVTGRIGSGKSTLAALLAGIEEPDSGTITTERISSRIFSMQFPEYHLTHMTIGREIESWDLDLEPVMNTAGLCYEEDRDPMTLSRGELKRLHLACIIQKKYDLMILDEPFSSLDCIWKRKFRDMLDEICGGVRIIFTHESKILPSYDHLWNMSDGILSMTE